MPLDISVRMHFFPSQCDIQQRYQQRVHMRAMMNTAGSSNFKTFLRQVHSKGWFPHQVSLLQKRAGSAGLKFLWVRKKNKKTPHLGF